MKRSNEIVILMIIGLFALVGCNLGEETSSSDSEEGIRSTPRESKSIIIESNISSNEMGLMLVVSMPSKLSGSLNNMTDLETTMTVRDTNNKVYKWPLIFAEVDSKLTATLTVPRLAINSVAMHFYALNSGLIFPR